MSSSDQELGELRTLSSKKFSQGFYNAWTRKEAFIKAVGHGLSFPLKEFTVSLSPGRPAELLETAFDRGRKATLDNQVPGRAPRVPRGFRDQKTH